MASLTRKEINRRNYLHKRETGYYKKEIERLRKVALEKLGDKCVRCGFSDRRALQVDHINNDGCIERKKKWNKATLYRKIIAGVGTKYQLLCANCNWIKRSEFMEVNK